MARSKTIPIRRETSSEYISKHDRTPNMADGSVANGSPDGKASAAAPATHSAQWEPGLTQLAIAVGGIYASL